MLFAAAEDFLAANRLAPSVASITAQNLSEKETTIDSLYLGLLREIQGHIWLTIASFSFI